MTVAARKLDIPATASSPDRRTARRVSAESLPQLAARLVAGPEVALIDVSSGGARFESDNRLLPGSSVGLRLVQDEAVFVVMARVVRSRVARLESGNLRYESAVAFDRQCPMLTEDMLPADLKSVAPTGANAGPLATAPDTSLSEPSSVGAHPAAATSSTPSTRPTSHLRVLTLTAVVPKAGPDVRRVLSRNRW